jgi:hypothetical protein
MRLVPDTPPSYGVIQHTSMSPFPSKLFCESRHASSEELGQIQTFRSAAIAWLKGVLDKKECACKTAPAQEKRRKQ